MDRHEQMRSWLARREKRGLTFRELSLETGVPVGTLGFWAWKLRRESRDDDAPSPFVELVAKQPESGDRLEIVLANGNCSGNCIWPRAGVASGFPGWSIGSKCVVG